MNHIDPMNGSDRTHDYIRACEAEFAALSARMVAVASTNYGFRNNVALPESRDRAVYNRLDRVVKGIDALERRLGSRGAPNHPSFLHDADALYDDIQAFLGLPSLDVQLQGMKNASKPANAVNVREPTWTSSPTRLDPSLATLISKYGTDRSMTSSETGIVEDASVTERELSTKYSVQRAEFGGGPAASANVREVAAPESVARPLQAIEETTMELKSQLIFSALNRNPGQRSSCAPPIRPEPIQELADLPLSGPTPGKETKIDDRRLEDAIAAALARSFDANEKETSHGALLGKDATTTPATCVADPKLQTASLVGSRSTTNLSSSLTPKVPASLPCWQPVAEESYVTLPSFVRNQIGLEELNSTSMAVHGRVAQRIGCCDASVMFTAEDVELHTTKVKAFVNALVKLNVIKLKVCGEQVMYYFC